MKIFLRLLSYILPYRYRFLLGIFVSFLVAFLQGISLSAFLPLFESLGENSEVYLSQFSKRERSLLRKAYGEVNAAIPAAPKKIDEGLANELLTHLNDKNAGLQDLSLLESVELRTLLSWKLQLSANALSPFHMVLLISLLLIPIYGLKLFFLLVCVRLIARAGYRAVRNIRNDLYRKTQRLPLTWYYKNKSGELVSRLSNDAEIVATVISSNMRDAITNVFYLVVNILILSYLNVQLLLVSIVCVPVILFPVTLFTRKIRKSTNRSQNSLADLHSHLQETISGMKLIRFNAMEEYEKESFQHINNRLYWGRFKEIYYNRLGSYLVELNSIIVTIGVLCLGVLFLDPSDFTSGEFLTFITVLLFIIRPIIQLSGMYAKIQSAIVAGQRIFEIMDKEFETIEPKSPIERKKLKSSIQFENVCFTYPETDQQVLFDINLDIPVGSTIALVGSSGGGKSTLMDLLARFFTPTSGRILFDGKDIQNFRVADYRSRIGIATQDIFLFHGSIYHNIAYGSEDHTKYAVEKVARLAHAHDFIMELPLAYRSLVGNRGLSLSGGQRQRISIARALLRDPEILILDEATSALDMQSEKLVQQALERLFLNRTTFVIAHRLSTIEKADKIVVVSDGHIVEQGDHAALLKKKGYYSYLQNIHTAGFA